MSRFDGQRRVQTRGGCADRPRECQRATVPTETFPKPGLGMRRLFAKEPLLGGLAATFAQKLAQKRRTSSRRRASVFPRRNHSALLPRSSDRAPAFAPLHLQQPPRKKRKQQRHRKLVPLFGFVAQRLAQLAGFIDGKLELAPRPPQRCNACKRIVACMSVGDGQNETALWRI